MATLTASDAPALTDKAAEAAKTSASIDEMSLADTSMLSATDRNVEPETIAFATEFPRFNAIIGATDTELLLPAVTLVARAAFRISASIDMSDVARTLTSPAPALRLEPVTVTSAPVGFAPAISVPINASTVLNNQFCASIPTLLNARITPTANEFPAPCAIVFASVVATNAAVLSAFTFTDPNVASNVESVTVVVAFACTTFDAMTAFTAIVLPPANNEPPSAVTTAVLVAVNLASSSASTKILPLADVIDVSITDASACAKTSLVTIIPPAAVLSLDDVFRFARSIIVVSNVSAAS